MSAIVGSVVIDAFHIDGPGQFLDRAGRIATVIDRASHNNARWDGIAGDQEAACWESNGVLERSLPSDIDLVARKPVLK
jgi:hypothetical protein